MLNKETKAAAGTRRMMAILPSETYGRRNLATPVAAAKCRVVI
jgi:hypothetical protein